ncbi:MAG: hypothetical protein JOZ23_11705, partial [Mycobacterium sp.]|nr:hypothetical protein [Mycobacterium sp.]
MAIVCRDLEYVEQVLGGPNYGEAALRGAGSGALVGALIGGAGVSASGSSVGLAANARAISAVIGYAVAGLFLLLALTPKFSVLVLFVPAPVLGAALVYLSCSVLISG